MNELAILGGLKAFPLPFPEKWARPKEKEKALLSSLIERDELSGSGFGVSLEFENAFASYIGCKHCLSFSHGTAAIMAAYYAAGVGPGDEVLTPAVGYIASYSGALHLGARPIFCDIHPDSLLIDPQEVKKKITSRTKAINITHLNGRVCDLEAILQICQQFDLPLIDDASHAHGASWKGTKLGNFSHVTCFSLQGTNPRGKAVSGGEGGIACTNDTIAYQKMLAYCHLHRKGLHNELLNSPFESLDNEVLGLKWRAHPLAMALALISLESLEERNQKRAKNYQKTIDCLKDFPFISFPIPTTETEMGGFYGGLKLIYHSTKLEHLSFERFLQCLFAEGVPLIEVGVGSCEYRRFLVSKGFDLWGNHRGPLFDAWEGLETYKGLAKHDFPHAESMDNCVFTLPCFIDVDDDYYTCLAAAFHKIEQDSHRLLR